MDDGRPYRETREKVRQYGARGILAVDMEFAALAQVAAFRGIELVSVLLTSDVLHEQPWQPGFRRKEFGKRSRWLVEALFSCCRERQWMGKAH